MTKHIELNIDKWIYFNVKLNEQVIQIETYVQFYVRNEPWT